MNKTMRKFLIIFAAFAAISNLGAIAETTPAKPLNLRAETNTVNMDMVIKDNFVIKQSTHLPRTDSCREM